MSFFQKSISLFIVVFISLISVAQACEQGRAEQLKWFVDDCAQYNYNYNWPNETHSSTAAHWFSRGVYNGINITWSHCVQSLTVTTPSSTDSYTINRGGGGVYDCETVSAAQTGAQGPSNSCVVKGSIVLLEKKALSEIVPLVGTSFELAYSSAFQPGRISNRKIKVPISGSTPRDYITSFDVEVKRNGIVVDSANITNNSPNLNYEYIWNGMDASNSSSIAFQKFDVLVSESSPSGSFHTKYTAALLNLDTRAYGIGGWLPTVLRIYDHSSKVMYDPFGGSKYVEAKEVNSNLSYIADEKDGVVYFFDANGRHLYTKTSFLGALQYSFSYDSNGRLLNIEEPFGRITTFNRNSSGQLQSITSPSGSITSFLHNSDAYLASVQNPANEIYEFTYHTGGLLSTFQKPGGQSNTFLYDSEGFLAKDSHSGGFFFDLVGYLNDSNEYEVSTITTMGRETKVRTAVAENNDYHRKLTLPTGREQSISMTAISTGGANYSSSADGVSTSISYVEDPRFTGMRLFPQSINYYDGYSSKSISNVIDVTLSNISDPFSISAWSVATTSGFSSSETVYNPSHKKFSTTSGLGRTSEYSVDSYERLISGKIGNLATFTFTYTNEHLTSVVQGTRTTSMGYHSTTGNLQSITNPLSQTTSFVYDNANRVTSKILPDARAIGFGYDANGNVTSVTPPNRPAHYFSVNGQELVGSYAPPALSGVSVVNTLYSYNLDKQLTQVTRPDGAVIDFNYNATTGVLENFVTPDGTYTLTMDYNNGLPSSIVTADGYQTQISYAGRAMIGSTVYDSAWGMIGAYAPSFTNMLVQSDSVTGGDWNASQVNYAYDDDENLTGAGDLTLAYNVPNGQLTGTSITSGSNTITDVYTYNSYGEVTGYEAKLGTTTIYSLSLPRDASGRINGKTQTMSSTTDAYEYTFDLAGRLTETKKNSVVVATYAYDSNSNRNGGTIGSQPTTATYDDQDRLSTYNTLSFTYNANGDLLTKTNNTLSQTTQYVYDVFGNLKQVTLPNTTVISYEIDGLNRRVGRKVNGVLDRRWIYMDQYRIAAETDASGVITKRFVYGSKGNIPDYMISGGENYRIISDHLGSPRLVVKVSDGTIIHQMNHDEFGRVTQDTNPGYLPFGFAGGLYDTQTGLVRFGARDYDAEVGRWTSKDPILFNGGDANLYGYVQKDPVNWTDPSGLDRRRCSRNLKGSPIKVGKLRHDYVQFRDSKGNIVIKSWGNSGMINESSSAEGLQCEDWKKSSDKADSLAMGLADNLNDLMSYDLINYNCQNYSTDVLSFQMGQ